ncbi:MAG TPA: hypothetical protein VGG91_12505 [Myxococcaceae bacterium]|jgi:hypothetical protein
MLRRAVAVIGVALLGFFFGVLACFLSTPFLWKLEAPTGLELAGHSGPADWLLMTAGFLGAALAVGLHRWVVRRPSGARG